MPEVARRLRNPWRAPHRPKRLTGAYRGIRNGVEDLGEAPGPSACDSWLSDRDYAYGGRYRVFGHRKQHECAGKTRRSDLSRRLTRRMTYSWERLATSRGSKQPRARVKWNVP